MNFLADKGIDRQIVERLRQEGYSVSYIAEMSPSISDDEVINIANKNEALLITGDKDFGDLVYRQHRIMSGIILVRLAGISSTRKAEIVVQGINKHLNELQGAFSVITFGTIRILRKSN